MTFGQRGIGQHLERYQDLIVKTEMPSLLGYFLSV
jgi:hypothetical protein